MIDLKEKTQLIEPSDISTLWVMKKEYERVVNLGTRLPSGEKSLPLDLNSVNLTPYPLFISPINVNFDGSVYRGSELDFAGSEPTYALLGGLDFALLAVKNNQPIKSHIVYKIGDIFYAESDELLSSFKYYGHKANENYEETPILEPNSEITDFVDSAKGKNFLTNRLTDRLREDSYLPVEYRTVGKILESLKQ